MITFRVAVPDDKTSCFVQVTELTGANAGSEDFELTNEIKEMPDNRRKHNCLF